MAILLNDNIQIEAGKHIDNKYGPYNDLASVLTTIPSFKRARGLTVGVIEGGLLKEYWFKEGINNNDLVEKTTVTNNTGGGVGIDTGVRSLTANWQSTFSTVSSLSASWGNSGGVGVISKTYAELKALKDASQLVPGQYYKVTDFQLKWWNQSKNDVRIITSFEIEPLIILAIANNKFSQNAYSDLYPKDTIYYGFDDAPFATPGSNYLSIPNAHGWISRRISDGSSTVDAPYDWRHITWNCCRLDLSSFSEWSSSVSYNRRDIIKYNNKLFISLDSGNLNNIPDGARLDGNGDISDSTNFYWWIAVTPFVEGLTYFPTNELDDSAFKLILPSKINFKLPFDENSIPPVVKYSPSYGYPLQAIFSINNYYPNPSDYVTIPWSTNRTQKPTFARNPTTIDSQNYFSGPVKMGADSIGNVFYKRASCIEFGTNCSWNVFAGETFFLQSGSYFSCNKIGFSCFNNKFGNSCYYNSIGNGSTRNTLGEDCNFNIFQTGTNNNTMIGTFRNNILGAYLENNIVDNLFLSNFCGYSFTTNKIGTGVIGNFFKLQFSNNVLDGNVANNEVYCNNCKIGSGFNNNTGNIYNSVINGANKCVFPTIAPFNGNICNNMLCCEFSWYVLDNRLDNVSYLTSTNTFTYNNISSMVRGIFGYWFRMNTIESNVYNNINADIVFTNATLTANDTYNKRIFKNSAGVPRLSYYNSSDVQVVTSPTA